MAVYNTSRDEAYKTLLFFLVNAKGYYFYCCLPSSLLYYHQTLDWETLYERGNISQKNRSLIFIFLFFSSSSCRIIFSFGCHVLPAILEIDTHVHASFLLPKTLHYNNGSFSVMGGISKSQIRDPCHIYFFFFLPKIFTENLDAASCARARV